MGTLHQLRRFMADSLTNLVNGIGSSKDPRTAWMYVFEPMTRDQLEAAYRSDWIARRIVDAPAADATREWREWQTDQGNIEKLENEEKRLDLRRQMKRGLTKARLYGGSALVMGVANQGLSEDEMSIDRVRQGDLKFVAVFHQHELTPGPRIRDINSPWFNQPEYYTLTSDVENVDEQKKISSGSRIHPSRVIMLTGNELPDINVLGGSSNIWGDSVLQVVDEAVKAAGVVIGGIAGLVADAKMDVINIPGLSDKLADEEGSASFIKRFSLANQMKSSVNTLLLDEKETWSRISTPMAGLPPLVEQYLSVAAGAAEIPVSRLLGGAKGKGLSGSEGGGETDIRNYYDAIGSMQRNELSPTLTPLDNVLMASALGRVDESIYYEWTPLWQLSDTEKADISNKKAVTVQADVTMGLINTDVLREARINQLIEDGFYPGIEDAIDEFGAEPEEPPAPTEEDVQAHLGMMQKSAGTLKTVAKAAGLDKPPPAITKDAAPRTLYVRRDVLNAKAILRWARKQGIEPDVLPEDMHVTVTFSKRPVDWMKMGDNYGPGSYDERREVRGGPRLLDLFGPAKDVLVLLFNDYQLTWRHDDMVQKGCSWEWPEYQPHITLVTKGAQSVDVFKIKAYDGPIVLGPEIFEEVKEKYT